MREAKRDEMALFGEALDTLARKSRRRMST